jgi:hypothetical protein
MFLLLEESYSYICYVLVGYIVLVAQTGSYTHDIPTVIYLSLN